MDASTTSEEQHDLASTQTPQHIDANASAQALTVLWGTWEMWCDVPPCADGGGDAARARSTSLAASEQPYNNNNNSMWLDRVRSVGLFDSAEGFWGMFQCTVLPSQLPAGTSYYLFRKHVAPMWEHEANRRGGKWVMVFTATPAAMAAARQTAADPASECVLPVDVAWQRLCLALIGELLPCDEEEVCGVTVSRTRARHAVTATTTMTTTTRAWQSSHGSATTTAAAAAASDEAAEWKLCLWTRSADDAATQMRVARYVAELLHLRSHDDDDSNKGSNDATAACGHDAHDHDSNKRATSVSAGAATTRGARQTMRLSYVVHRDVMLAKQQQQQGRSTGGGARSYFAPRYVL